MSAQDNKAGRTLLGSVIVFFVLALLGAAGAAAYFATGGGVPAPMIGIVGLGGAAVAFLLVFTGARGRPKGR
jgi:hypothetical protein